MQVLGVIAGDAPVAGVGVVVDAGEPSGLAGADSFGHRTEDGDDLVRRQSGVEQGVPVRSEKRVVQVEPRSSRVRRGPYRMGTVRLP